jgi:tetratricopeptide (TPR) repeat protein
MDDKTKKVGPRQPGPHSPFDSGRPAGQREEPGLLPTLGASMRSENMVQSFMVDPTRDLSYSEFHEVKPGYNPFTNGDLEGYEEYGDEFLDAHNPIVVEAKKANIDRRKQDDETRAASDWSLYTDVFASTVDAPSLLPGGTFVRAGKLGYNALRSAKAVGIASGVGAAVQEGGLHLTQPTRDGTESLMVIGGSVLVGAALGAGGSRLLTRNEFKKFSRALEEDLATDVQNPGEVSQEILRRMRSAGSAAVEDIKIDDLEIGGPRAVKAIAAATAAVKLNPGLELLTSKSVASRKTFVRLAENHVGTAAELDGRSFGAAAETAMKQYQRGNLSKVLVKFREAWSSARKEGWEGTRAEFNEAVSRAARRGDADPNGNPHVEAAAQSLRADLLDPLKDEAIGVGLLPEGVKTTTAPSYLYRVWNRPKVIARESHFRAVVRRWIGEEVDDAIARQEEIGIANNINRAVDLDDQLRRATARRDSLDTRLSKRATLRKGRVDQVRAKEGERFDLLRGRVPAGVIKAAKAAKDDDVMIRSVAEASRAPAKLAKHPVLDLLRERGGVQVGSPLDGELRAMGVDPRTAPGLFRRKDGLTAVDNLVASEHPILARLGADQRGYADPDEILAAIRDELAGAPIRTEDELAAEAARDALEANVEEWLESIGLPSNATAREVREHLDNALRNDLKLTDLDQRIGRLTGELEEFDRATDQIANERLIADAEVRKFEDELNDLEARINEVREFANASPRVALIVDHADAKKTYGKARYEQAKIDKRIEAIEAALDSQPDPAKSFDFPEDDIVGQGDFGPILKADAYKDDWPLLVERMKSLQDGEAPGALHHPEVGPIDLVWGSHDASGKGHGLKKLLERHQEVVPDLPEIIRDSIVEPGGNTRKVLRNGAYKSVIRLDWDEQHKQWLLTSYLDQKSQRAPGNPGAGATVNRTQPSSSSLADRNIATEGTSFNQRANIEDLQGELRTLRADKNKMDERVIRARQKVEKLKPMLPKDRGEDLDFIDAPDKDGYINEIVDGIFDNITGRAMDEDVPDWMVPIARGPLKGRTFRIPDALVEDFLENDVEMIARRYVRTMAADVELTRAFGRADMKDQFAEIRADYDKLRARAKTDKERLQLGVQEQRDIRHIEAFRDMLRGTYRAVEEQSNWSAFTRLALGWNYIVKLGGVTLSSLPDLMSVVTRNGLRSFMDDGLPALVSNTKALRIAKRDAMEMGAVTETVLQSRLAELADLHDPYASGTMADRIMGNVTTAFSKLTFLDRWNDMNKSIVAVMTGNKVSRLLLSNIDEVPDKWGVVGKQVNFAGLSKHERGYLGKLGIDEAMGTRIADQIQRHGLQENGVWGLNVRAWTDKDAKRAIAAALNKEVDGVVVTPGVADRPLWARSNTGKMIMQFKSFGLAAHQRLLLSRLQGRPKHMAEFILLGSLFGMMVSYLKYIERGDFEAAERLTENPGLWIADGFDRTGIASVLMEVSNTGEKLGLPFGVKTAAQLLAGDEDRGADVSRYASRNTAGALLGPSIGTLQDIATIASQAAQGEFNSQGARAIVRNIPFGTLPGIRPFLQTQVKPALESATD